MSTKTKTQETNGHSKKALRFNLLHKEDGGRRRKTPEVNHSATFGDVRRLPASSDAATTAQTPPDLARATEYLREQPEGSVLVLPNMFADFVMYNSGKPVVWGGHSGNLARLEEWASAQRKSVESFFTSV